MPEEKSVYEEIGELHQRIRSLEARLRDAGAKGKALAEKLSNIVEVLESRNEYGPKIDSVYIDSLVAVYRRGNSYDSKVLPIPEDMRDVIKEIYDQQTALEKAKDDLRLAEERADSVSN